MFRTRCEDNIEDEVNPKDTTIHDDMAPDYGSLARKKKTYLEGNLMDEFEQIKGQRDDFRR